MLALPKGLRFPSNARRIFPVPAGYARRIGAQPSGSDHALERQVSQGVGLDKTADLFDGHLRCYQFRLVWGVYTVITRANRGRTTYAHVDFLCSGLANHAHDLLGSRAANDRVVNQNHSLTVYEIAHRIELDSYPKGSYLLTLFDKRSAHVMISDKPKPKT